MKKGILTILAVLMFAGLAWAAEPFYETLNQAQRYDLSQAYLAVSEHFKEAGDEERATQYRIVADQILTSIATAPAEEMIQENRESEKESSAMEPSEETTPVDERTQKAVMYYFNKLCSSLVIGNVEKTMEGLAFPFSAGAYTLDAATIEEDLQFLADNYDASDYGPEDVWYLDTAEFAWEDNGVVLSLVTAVYDPGMFLFWNDPQNFHFIQEGRAWKLQSLD